MAVLYLYAEAVSSRKYNLAGAIFRTLSADLQQVALEVLAIHKNLTSTPMEANHV